MKYSSFLPIPFWSSSIFVAFIQYIICCWWSPAFTIFFRYLWGSLALSPLREKEEIGDTASYPPSSVTPQWIYQQMCVCVCSEGAGCSFDSPTQLAQLLGVGVERERTRCTAWILCGRKEEETEGPFLPRFTCGREWTNKQAKKKIRNNPVIEHCFGLTCIKFCPRSPPQSQESLSLSTLISVQRHSDKTQGSSVWLWVFISIHPIVFIHLCVNIYVLLWRHLGAYVCKDSDTRSFCDLHLRPICCFSTCSQWVQFWLSLKRDVQWIFFEVLEIQLLGT